MHINICIHICIYTYNYGLMPMLRIAVAILFHACQLFHIVAVICLTLKKNLTQSKVMLITYPVMFCIL